MGRSELLAFVVAVFNRLGIPYFVTGSVASIYFGEPRFTNDIDIVVRLGPTHVKEFCCAFPEDDFYLSQEAVLDAIRRRCQFNIIHPSSGLKVDVIVPPNDAFNQSRFARVIRARLEDSGEVFFSSPEDLIIKKMDFFSEGGSEKHLRDIAGVLRISGQRVDRSYISAWADRMGLDATWRAIVARADAPEPP